MFSIDLYLCLLVLVYASMCMRAVARHGRPGVEEVKEEFNRDTHPQCAGPDKRLPQRATHENPIPHVSHVLYGVCGEFIAR